MITNNKGNFLQYNHILHETEFCVVYKGLHCNGDEENHVVWNIYHQAKLDHSQKKTIQDKVKQIKEMGDFIIHYEDDDKTINLITKAIIGF